MTEDSIGYGSTNWSRGAGRAIRMKQEYADAHKERRRTIRSIDTEICKIEYAKRHPHDHHAVRAAQAAEARLIELRNLEANLVKRMRALQVEAATGLLDPPRVKS